MSKQLSLRKRMVLGIALALAALVVPAGSASATISPQINSSFSFNTTLTGASIFHVSGNGIAAVRLGYLSASPFVKSPEFVQVSVLRRQCFIGICNWNQVGPTCTMSLTFNHSADCAINAGNSSDDSRFYFSKPFDGVTISGSALLF